MAPSAMPAVTAVNLPTHSKASLVSASVLHGPRDLRLVSRVRAAPALWSIFAPRLGFCQHLMLINLTNTTGPLSRRLGLLRNRAMESYKLLFGQLAFVALTSRTTRSLLMAISVPAHLFRWAMSLLVPSLRLAPR